MSEEQINDVAEVEQAEETGLAEQETEVTESGTATDKKAEEQQEEPDYQKIISEKAYEARQAKREKEELARRLAEIEAQKPKETRPNVPPIPDPWDDNFEEKVRQRDEALAKASAYDAQQRIIQEQEQAREQERLQKQQQELATRVTTYSERAKQLGIEAQELAQAGQRLSGQVSDDVASYILDNEQGPLMTKYLSANPLELDRLQSMNPMQAAVYLETQVKPKAAQLGRKKVSQAPEPVETLNGGGAAPERGPKGAKFE